MPVRRSAAQVPRQLATLRKKIREPILMSEADVSDASRNASRPGQSPQFCYTVGELVLVDFRLTFGWSGSPGFWVVISAAAAHGHRNTTIGSAQLSDEINK